MHSHVGVKVDVHVDVFSPRHCSNYASLLKLCGVRSIINNKEKALYRV